MARKPNCGFVKRQKELTKKAIEEEKGIREPEGIPHKSPNED